LAKAHDELLAAVRSFLEATSGEPVPAFIGSMDWSMPERRIEPRLLPCLEHLPAAAAIAAGAGRRLAELLASAGGRFAWRQTYSEADLGPEFMANYGWLEVFGTRGHFANGTVAGGVLMLGPETVYPDHHHQAEEVYIPLTGGTDWRMGDGPFGRRAAGEIIHHRPNVNHAMRTGREPLLAFYLWRGGPLAARSTFAEVNAARAGKSHVESPPPLAPPHEGEGDGAGVPSAKVHGRSNAGCDVPSSPPPRGEGQGWGCKARPLVSKNSDARALPLVGRALGWELKRRPSGSNASLAIAQALLGRTKRWVWTGRRGGSNSSCATAQGG
jgi:hypothetical protein